MVQAKRILKISLDILMTLSLVILMSYELIAEGFHEWIGIVFIALFIFHHILNADWEKNIFKGRYNSLRIVQSVLVFLILLCMISLVVSGIILSQYVFSFLHINKGYSFAKGLHMLSSYWGFILMALHLGLHWNSILLMIKKNLKNKSIVSERILRVLALLISLYGIFAFFKRDFGVYMFLQSHFVFFDYSESVMFFLLDYIAIFSLFVSIGHYGTRFLKNKNKSEKL